jgi:hypothetical protein
MKTLYTVEFWVLTEDGYDNRYVCVEAYNEEQAISKAKKKKETHRGKDFTIILG